MTFNFLAVWFKRPYKGPQLVVEIIGADMNVRGNRFFDFWSKPDSYVTCRHGDTDRRTQIEGNTYNPRFVWQASMPHKSKYGFHFEVMEANVLKGDNVMGRAFLDIKQVKEMIKSGEPALLSMGENIGKLKVQLSHLPNKLSVSTFQSTPLMLDDAPQETGLKNFSSNSGMKSI
eukprot:CAMPEP_0197737804 /NCGR_PEP_ID=MMETSP1435-20131217/11056_1 /TAXON_ID=426625 /ORGANISM="Chaetoceros brevis, Strain CCMP164" /LENGTH=173 /DNA_ID=CAMNT_0043326449 /DNA_START=1 /DNA_END=522 /DNA_ORIENTATION=+